MKKIYFILVLILYALAFQSCEKDDDLRHAGSQSVENAFWAKYPDAKHVEWEKKKAYWVADFYRDGKEMEAWFDNDGTWRMTETDLSFVALPEPVKTAFSSGNYQSWRIDDMDRIERKDMETIYVLEVESGHQEYDLYYSPDGTFIKAIADTYGNDDNEKYLL